MTQSLEELDEEQRRYLVEEARARLRARGVVLSFVVDAVYEQYIEGTCRWGQIHERIKQAVAEEKKKIRMHGLDMAEDQPRNADSLDVLPL